MRYYLVGLWLLLGSFVGAQPTLTLTEEKVESELLKEYVRSFSVREKDTILIALDVPYEIIDWDRRMVRIFSQVESFSLPDEYLTHLARKGRYSVSGSRSENVLSVNMDKVNHHISVQGVTLTDEVAVRIYVPHGVPLKVICQTKTPDEQLRDLWLQQEVLTRRMKYPVHRLINAEAYPDVRFLEGTITAARNIASGKRFLALTIQSGDEIYQTVSRIGKLYKDPSVLIGQTVIFVEHSMASSLRKCTNEGMVLVHENEAGELQLMPPSALPDFLLIRQVGS